MFSVELSKVTERGTLRVSASTMEILSHEMVYGNQVSTARQMTFEHVLLEFSERHVDVSQISESLYNFLRFLDRSENNVKLRVTVHCLEGRYYTFRDAVVDSLEWTVDEWGGDMFSDSKLKMTLAFRNREVTLEPPPPLTYTHVLLPAPIFTEQNLDWRELGF